MAPLYGQLSEARMQHDGDGIKFDTSQAEYKMCRWSESHVSGKDEEYIFPLWLLLLLLLLIILCCICSICMWFLRKLFPRKERRLVSRTSITGNSGNPEVTRLHVSGSPPSTDTQQWSTGAVIDARLPAEPHGGAGGQRERQMGRSRSDSRSSSMDNEPLVGAPPAKTAHILHEKFTPVSTPVSSEVPGAGPSVPAHSGDKTDDFNVYDQPDTSSEFTSHARRETIEPPQPQPRERQVPIHAEF